MPTEPTAPVVPPEAAEGAATISPEIAAIIAALGLSPAEGETEVSLEAITARIGELTQAATAAGETQTSLATAQADLEKVRGEYQALYEREEAARKLVEEAAADEILSQYKDRITTPGSLAVMRNMLLIDRAAAIEVLNGLAAPAAPVAEPPPEPMHKTPEENAEAESPEQKLAEANKLIADLRKTKPDTFGTYDLARNEVRRLRPDLFA